MNGSETKNATYTFEEAIDRIAHADDKETLELIAGVLSEERKEYALFHLKLICEAIRVRREFNIQFGNK